LIADQLSVENSMKQTAAIAAHARYPNSQGFFDAAEYVAARAREYGLQNVHIERFPQRAPLWDELEASLEVTAPVARKITAVLAQHSGDADLTAELTDSAASDMRKKILVTDSEPRDAIHNLGANSSAAAVISGASGVYFGRRTPPEAILWSEAPPDAVALMISPKDAADLRALLKRGPVTVHIRARAKRSSPGATGIVMGEIPGAESGTDVVLAAHLDHQLPGANDNASGSGTLLELARATERLLAAGKIPKLRRTLRFWWTTEITSEQTWFLQHPEAAKNILISVVLDQAGGELGAENNFIVIRNPNWLPSYADDLIENLAEYVQDNYAPAEYEPKPLATAPGGSAQSLRTVYWDYQPITDEVAFEARGVDIPGIALAVPSLRVIHTNLDTPARLDPTWMKRSALLTLAPALFLTNAGPQDARAILEYTFRRAAARLAMSRNLGRDLSFEQKRLKSVRGLDPQLDTSIHERQLETVANALRRR
jgi:aminopeptidase YwaD